jgi:hypothetical protein
MNRRFTLVLVVFLVVAVFASLAYGEPTKRKYHVYGRDPMVPGGITESMLKPGQVVFELPYDTYFSMRGAHGEWASGWGRKGDRMVGRIVTVKVDAETIVAYKAELVQYCGNTVVPFWTPAPAPTPEPEVQIEYRDREVLKEVVREVEVPKPYPVEVEVPIYYTVERHFYTPHPASAIEVPSPQRIIYYKDGIMDGLLRIGAAYVGRTRVSITQNAPVNTSSSASSASASSSTSTNTNSNYNSNTNSNYNSNENNLQQQQQQQTYVDP